MRCGAARAQGSVGQVRMRSGATVYLHWIGTVRCGAVRSIHEIGRKSYFAKIVSFFPGVFSAEIRVKIEFQVISNLF